MNNATNYFEAIILNLLRGISATAPSNIYLALYLNDPSETGEAGTEVTYQGYTRMPIILTEPASMNDGIGVQNVSEITFPTSPIAAGTVNYIGLRDSLTGGNMYAYAELDEPLVIQANEAPVFVAGEAAFWWMGELSHAYMTKALNLLRGTNVSGFTPYLALFNGSPESGGSELSGGGYGRVALTFGAPAVQPSGQTNISNSAAATTARATTSWGTWTYTAVYDAVSSGIPVYYKSRASKEMRKGLLAKIDVGGLTLAVN